MVLFTLVSYGSFVFCKVLLAAFLLHVWCSKKSTLKMYLPIEMNEKHIQNVSKCIKTAPAAAVLVQFLSHVPFFQRCQTHWKCENTVKMHVHFYCRFASEQCESNLNQLLYGSDFYPNFHFLYLAAPLVQSQ